MKVKGHLGGISRAAIRQSCYIDPIGHAHRDPSQLSSDAARLTVTQRVVQRCRTARTAAREAASPSGRSPACFGSQDADGTGSLDLRSRITAIEDLPAVWIPTSSPQASSFLHELVSLPQQYTPVFGKVQQHQAERLMDAPDVHYPVLEAEQYGPAGPGISPSLEPLLRDALQSSQQSSAASASVAQGTAAQSSEAAPSTSASSSTLIDILHLEAALLNVVLDATKPAPSSGPLNSPAKAPSPVAPAQNRRQARILVVDDDQDVGRVTSAFLRKAGFEVITVGSGNAALAALSADPGIDTLITDYAMVGTNGVELVLQARELHADLRALVITGYVGAEGLERLPPDVAVLRKPFQRESFVHQVIGLVESTAPSKSVGAKDLQAEASALTEFARS